MRHPNYHPIFTHAEIDEIRKTCRQRNVPHVQFQRAQIALCLIENPKIFSTEIAERVGPHPETVRKWRKRFDYQRGIEPFTYIREHDLPLAQRKCTQAVALSNVVVSP